MKPNLRIRKALLKDIDKVYSIEQEQFPHPWKKNFFISELSHDIARFFVAEDTDSRALAGYIIFWIIEETIELHDIAVAESYKRKGIASKLVDFLLDTADGGNVIEVFLEVRKSNQAAIAFYETYNFKKIDERKNYYKKPTENALVLKLEIGNLGSCALRASLKSPSA
ncbi:MAG: ribosomal protein S18-alanine N-acetyltransferase [bacterium]|nr:ribosomal protein S18-alanine N-acetyltransferase [bacterium]